MKIIDLLNKIANGEELPKKIKYKNLVFIKYYFPAGYGYDISSYKTEDSEHYIVDYLYVQYLNDEIEIIEDTPKKIEKLKLYAPYPECDENRFDDIQDKINEIIDYINKEDNNGIN